MVLSELLSTAAVFVVGMAHAIRLQTVCFVVGQITEPVEEGVFSGVGWSQDCHRCQRVFDTIGAVCNVVVAS